jgi:anti-sigma factor RsiW
MCHLEKNENDLHAFVDGQLADGRVAGVIDRMGADRATAERAAAYRDQLTLLAALREQPAPEASSARSGDLERALRSRWWPRSATRAGRATHGESRCRRSRHDDRPPARRGAARAPPGVGPLSRAGLPKTFGAGGSWHGPDLHHHAAGRVVRDEVALDRERVGAGAGVLPQEFGHPVHPPLGKPATLAVNSTS